jgi:hypothetical protein
MSSSGDPYWKLRPAQATPPDEICACPGAPAIVLLSLFAPNPLTCAECRKEVPPERIGFSERLAEQIAFWRTFHDSLYNLWLDSGDYEEWAGGELSDPECPVHVRGLELVARLNEHRRCWYWWFQDSGADDFVPLEACPRCGLSLDDDVLDGWLVCNSCSIVVAN